MKPLHTVRALCLTLAVMPPPSAAGQDWPGWRGPHHDGSASTGGVRNAEHLDLKVLWRRKLGTGYSGISVTGSVAVTQFADDRADWLIALDVATGTELWRVRLDDKYRGHDGSDDGPSATPDPLAVGPG